MNDIACEGACLQASRRTLITSCLPSAASVRPSEQPARAVIGISGKPFTRRDLHRLVRGEDHCRTCPDGLQRSNLEYEWSFALTIEIEQEGCDIFGIAPDTDYRLHVHVAERYGETVCVD